MKKVQLFCVTTVAALIIASCSTDGNADSQAIESPEKTVATFETPDETESPESEGPADTDGSTPEETDPPAPDPAAADTDRSAGVVPKVEGDAIPAAPKKEAAEPATKPAEPAKPTTAPKPAPAEPNPGIPSGGNASPIERRIADLTNQLRTNPNGPLKRTGKVPRCGDKLKFDSATGQPAPLPALKFDDKVSVQMARPWSAQMSPSNFNHRPDQKAVLNSLGITPRAWGENIAYHAPPKSDPAMFHFTQWRQSDGHFCNMMGSNYTHIAVGEDQHGGGSFATQNFFATS